MSRTYRRCTNKKQKPEVSFEVKQNERCFNALWESLGGFIHRKVFLHYKTWFYTSDRDLKYDTRFLKHFEARKRRAHEHKMLVKMTQDIEIFDDFGFDKTYENPWNFD